MKLLPHRSLTLAACLAVAALALPASAQDEPAEVQDTVTVQNGSTKTLTGGQVGEYTYESVSYKGRKVSGTVVSIHWGDAPREYARGLRSLAGGDAEGARVDFDFCLSALAAGQVRDWVEEYANIGLGESYVILASRDAKKRGAYLGKAKAAFTAARNKNPKSLASDRLLRGLANAELMAGNALGALSAAGALGKAGSAARQLAWEVEGQMLAADVKRNTGEHAAAASAYENVQRFAESRKGTAKTDDDRRLLEKARRRAAAQKGWVMVDKAQQSKAKGDFDKAKTYFASLKGSFGDAPEILAAASNALGVITYESEKYRDAVRQFQVTEVRHFSVGDEVARSLYYQSLCWHKLGDAQRKGAAERDLKKNFPRSEWARKLP